MSTSYRTRKKAIRDEKRRIGPKGLIYGQIPEMDFYTLQANWHSKVTGPPIGTLADLMEARHELESRR